MCDGSVGAHASDGSGAGNSKVGESREAGLTRYRNRFWNFPEPDEKVSGPIAQLVRAHA